MYDIAKSNGPLAEVNSHDIDTLRWFTGSEVKNAACSRGQLSLPGCHVKLTRIFYDTVLMVTHMYKRAMLGCIDGAQGVAIRLRRTC